MTREPVSRADPCQCGHQRSRHVDDGRCLGEAGSFGACAGRCYHFRLDNAALARREAEAHAVAAIHARIERAREFVDAGAPLDRWKPSELLSIGYSVMATGPHPQTGEIWLDEQLAEARRRWKAGLPANPFHTLSDSVFAI